MLVGKHLQFSEISFLNVYNRDCIRGISKNYIVNLDEKLRVISQEKLQLEISDQQNTSSSMYSTGYDRHCILFKKKTYACMEGALYQLGNNFHKVMNIPNLLGDDCSQNMAVCGDYLIISNYQGQIFKYCPVTKELSNVTFFEDFVEVLRFADRCFLLTKERNIYHLDPDTLEARLIVNVESKHISSMLDEGGIIIMRKEEDGTFIIVDAITNKHYQIEALSELRFSNFDNYACLSYLGYSYSLDILQKTIVPLVPDYFEKRFRYWFQYLCTHASQHQLERFIEYVKKTNIDGINTQTIIDEFM